MLEWHVYILDCTASTGRVTVHVGIAKDPEKRFMDHLSGKVKATAGRDIIRLGYSKPMSQGDALSMEARLKKKGPMDKRKVAAAWEDR